VELWIGVAATALGGVVSTLVARLVLHGLFVFAFQARSLELPISPAGVDRVRVRNAWRA
jgi:hypothetical protein